LEAAIEGFWLPQGVRERVLSPETVYVTSSFADGRPCEPDDEEAVTVHWPRLRTEQWAPLLATLQGNRQRAPRGQAFWGRLQAALGEVGRRFAEPSDPLRALALAALPGYTGYSEPMIRFTLGALDLMALEQLPAAFALPLTYRSAGGWRAMRGLIGRLRFYPARRWLAALGRLPGCRGRPLFRSMALPDLVVGYGAGNVPGSALLIAFLAQAATLAGGAPPLVVVRNSRREPIFAPLVLKALEAVDPDLVSTVAVLVWDHEDRSTQDRLLSQADLVVATASDESMAQIAAQVQSARERRTSPPVRFHAHGHKVSFSAIAREVLAHGLVDPASGQPLLDVVTTLAALDSVFWDQHGCLSSRIHFVEEAGPGHHTPLEYASGLESRLRLIAAFLPRGTWPRQPLHDRFDRYKLLETTGQVQVLTRYDDEFLVVVDRRPLSPAAFHAAVNDCQGRVIIVRPVADLMEVPMRWLRLLPARNLQSLSVAVGHAEEGLTERFLRFAGACGARGVTAIRTVGRGAFPQLSYSWDGLIPLDLVRRRPAGRFTTIEFDAPHRQMLETYRVLLQRGADLGVVER
jgi:hypothetical protein